jgi:hypothetical protein
VKVGTPLPLEVKLSNISIYSSELHKNGVGLMQNHQLPTLIQIKTALPWSVYFCILQTLSGLRLHVPVNFDKAGSQFFIFGAVQPPSAKWVFFFFTK